MQKQATKLARSGLQITERLKIWLHAIVNWVLRRIVFVDDVVSCFRLPELPPSWRDFLDLSRYEIVPAAQGGRILIAIVGARYCYSESHVLPLPSSKAVRQVVKNMPNHAPFAGLRRTVLQSRVDDLYYAESTTVHEALVSKALSTVPLILLPINWLLSAHSGGDLAEYDVGGATYFIYRKSGVVDFSAKTQAVPSLEDFALTVGAADTTRRHVFGRQDIASVLVGCLFSLSWQHWWQAFRGRERLSWSPEAIRSKLGLVFTVGVFYVVLSSALVLLQDSWLDYRLRTGAAAAGQAIEARKVHDKLASIIQGLELSFSSSRSADHVLALLNELHNEGMLLGSAQYESETLLVTAVTRSSAAEVLERLKTKPNVKGAKFTTPVSTDSKGNELFTVLLSFNGSGGQAAAESHDE